METSTLLETSTTYPTYGRGKFTVISQQPLKWICNRSVPWRVRTVPSLLETTDGSIEGADPQEQTSFLPGSLT